MKYSYLTFYLISFGFILSGCTTGWDIQNPYEQVDWENHQQYKANLHTHTTRSDGRFSPHTVVDNYYRMGYKILALTDHNEVTYPWTDFSNMKPSDRSLERFENGVLGQEALTYENRNPETMGMVSVQGNEVSAPHHINSFFTDYEQRTDQEEIALEAIESFDGVAVINHPGRYTDKNPEKYNGNWYRHIITRFDHIV